MTPASRKTFGLKTAGQAPAAAKAAQAKPARSQARQGLHPMAIAVVGAAAVAGAAFVLLSGPPAALPPGQPLITEVR
ncbi:MAG: hypothetical protein ACRCTI_02980 [Beijerinckiaceae bacterium]